MRVEGLRRAGSERVRVSVLAVLVAFALASCTAPSPPPPSGVPLHQALYKSTGYQLGDTTGGEGGGGLGNCAAESRYGKSVNAPVLLLICVYQPANAADRVTYRVNYTSPTAGHRVWKISATYPDKRLQDLGFVDDFEGKYGPPHKLTAPLTLTWQLEQAYLELREDRYGAHMQLWDRSLR
ncbi:hypothetical protein [Sneathiella sp.]|uniref:hypothetical protein n=1 Tax=Sneathiella sp. TaxID=1964365 RepID=UPI00356136AF